MYFLVGNKRDEHENKYEVKLHVYMSDRQGWRGRVELEVNYAGRIRGKFLSFLNICGSTNIQSKRAIAILNWKPQA